MCVSVCGVFVCICAYNIVSLYVVCMSVYLILWYM